MKTISISCYSLGLGCRVASCLLFYYAGYTGRAIFPLVSYLFYLLSFLFLFGLGVTWLLALKKRKDLLFISVLMAALCATYVPMYVIPRVDCYEAYGFRDHLLKICSLSDLRCIAEEVHREMKSGTYINHGDTHMLSSSEKYSYSLLRNKYPFLHWDNDRGPSIYTDDKVVNFLWGGYYPGHWGCSIALNNAVNLTPVDSDHFVRISDDIYFFAVSY